MQLTKKIIIFILCVILIIFFSTGLKLEQPVEELEIVTGVGLDMEIQSAHRILYNAIFSTNKFIEGGKRENMIVEGKAYSLSRTRDERQRGTDKQNILGFEKVFIISEGFARNGIRNILDIVFNNPNINDSSYTAVCAGKSKDILKAKIDGYTSSSDFIYGLLRNSRYYNFFKEEYKVVDMYFIVDTEGRNLSLPYIEFTPDGLKVTGLAIFKGDKMVAKLNMQNTRILNLLKEDSAHGVLTAQYGNGQYVDFYAKTKRKVHCDKKEGKYIFTIDVDINGEVTTNTTKMKLTEENKDIKKFQKDLADQVKDKCYKFIGDMQKKYEVDCFDLGKYGAAKYGRHTGVDWNKAVSDSKIIVNIKVNVQKMGRGGYYAK